MSFLHNRFTAFLYFLFVNVFLKPPASSTTWNATDRLFVVGNGTGTGVLASNALTIYKDGKMNINDAYDMPTADGTPGQVLTTDGAGTISFQSPGADQSNTLDEAYDEGGAGVGRQIDASDGAVRVNGDDGFIVTGTYGSGDAVEVTGEGTRMFFNPNKGAFRAGYVNGTQWDDANIGNYSTAMGTNTTASGIYSTAMGLQTTASGSYSTAMGRNTTASGNYSTAMGYNTNASGNYSTAMGWHTTASGSYSTAMGANTLAGGSNSTAMGYNSTASGNYSTAMGYNTSASANRSTAMGSLTNASGYASTTMGANTSAPSYVETVIGRYNTSYTPASTTTWNSADRLFVVGNGSGSGAESDTLVVRAGKHERGRNRRCLS